MQILAIVGKSGTDKEKLLHSLDLSQIEIFDFARETEQLLKTGDEGHRQILNYFGEEFLYKDGRVNLNKLWKFVYLDFHKLKILNFLLESILFNQLQKRLDGSAKKACIVLLPGLAGIEHYTKFNNAIWLDFPDDQLLPNLRGRKLPVPAEKYLDTQNRLFLKPPTPLLICQNKEELIDQVEKWLKFV